MLINLKESIDTKPTTTVKPVDIYKRNLREGGKNEPTETEYENVDYNGETGYISGILFFSCGSFINYIILLQYILMMYVLYIPHCIMILSYIVKSYAEKTCGPPCKIEQRTFRIIFNCPRDEGSEMTCKLTNDLCNMTCERGNS